MAIVNIDPLDLSRARDAAAFSARVHAALRNAETSPVGPVRIYLHDEILVDLADLSFEGRPPPQL